MSVITVWIFFLSLQPQLPKMARYWNFILEICLKIHLFSNLSFEMYLMQLHHGSYKWIIMFEKCGRPDINIFHIKWIIGNHGNWKNKILWGVLELPAKVASKWENIFVALYQVGHRFLQVLSHFRGFEPHLRRYFFF